MENCVFCKIIQKKLPCYKVWENDEFLAFLSIAPINPGHTLVIPKQHLDYFFDLEEEILSQIMIVSKLVARALKKAFHPKTGKVGVMIAGGGVAHAHVHLIPMDNEYDLTFERQKHNVSPEEFEKNLQKIKENL